MKLCAALYSAARPVRVKAISFPNWQKEPEKKRAHANTHNKRGGRLVTVTEIRSLFSTERENSSVSFKAIMELMPRLSESSLLHICAQEDGGREIISQMYSSMFKQK